MMNKIIRTTLITLLLTFAAHAAAQQGLQIATVFQKYGKQKGVTMVELSNEMLETYQMTLYKVLCSRMPVMHYLRFSVAWKPTRRKQRR